MQLTPNYLPSLNQTGFYQLAAPYSSLISGTTQYTCVGTMSLAGAVAQGLDPLTNVYLANNDTKANYLKDLANNISLVTITSGTGNAILFPSSAMLAVPNGDGVIYRNMVLGIALSAIPDTMDLTTLQNQISDMVYNSLGVKSTTFVTQIGAPTILTTDQDTAVNAARSAVITSPSNNLHQIALLTAQIAAYQTQLNALQAWVIAHPPVP